MAEAVEIEKSLRELLDDNFSVSKHCRKTVGAIEDSGLKYLFQTYATKRSQFAAEIGDEIAFHGGRVPYIPQAAYERPWPLITEEKKWRAVKQCLKLCKRSYQKYKEALCKINDGSCREILIRHKSYIEKCIFELKSIKKLIKTYQGSGKNSPIKHSGNEIY